MKELAFGMDLRVVSQTHNLRRDRTDFKLYDKGNNQQSTNINLNTAARVYQVVITSKTDFTYSALVCRWFGRVFRSSRPYLKSLQTTYLAALA